jgi:mono/diheme cytochrome c family protein
MRRRKPIAIAAVTLAAGLIGSSAAAQDTAAIERGQKVYTANKCQTCHSIEGKGAKKGPLDGVGSKLSEDEIRQWIVNAPEMTKKTGAKRKPVMKNYAHLSKEDVDGLVAYMMSLKKS